MPPHVPGGHLRLEEPRGPRRQRLERQRQLCGRGRAQPPDLAQQPEQLGAPCGQPEDRPDDRLDPGPSGAGPVQGVLERR